MSGQLETTSGSHAGRPGNGRQPGIHQRRGIHRRPGVVAPSGPIAIRAIAVRAIAVRAIAVGAVVTGLAAAGCTTDPAGAGSEGRLVVATTVAPLTSIAAAIGGDRVEIEGIVPEGTNSHTFEPAPRVAELLSRADLVLTNGLQLEVPTEDLARDNMKDGAELVEVGNAVLPETEYIYDFSFPREEGKPNPHLWTDPTYAVKYARVIRDELVERDADNADYYGANFTKFERTATALADAVRADQESIPGGRRVLLTYHDAYAYFGRTFGWKIIGAVQPRNFEEPAPSEVARIIEQVRREKVPTIFGSEVFPSTVLAEIGRATGVRYEDTLRDDDLPGAPGEAKHSWYGLMRYNYMTMVRGLGGKATRLEALPEQQTDVPDRAKYPQ